MPEAPAAVSVATATHATVRPTRALWDRTLDPLSVTVRLADEAVREAVAFSASVDDDLEPGQVEVARASLPRLTSVVEECRARVDAGERIAVIAGVAQLAPRQRRMLAWAVAQLLGDPVSQNAAGDRLMPVYARPGTKRIADGARYHQTREGGALHTDNVSLPERWEYLVFSCVRPALVGGESLLVSGHSAHARLQRWPEALAILEQPFWWEYRGIADGVFPAPIVTYSGDGEPRFRYLRRYLESAHRQAGAPLTDAQLWSLDVLDGVLDLTELQFRLLLHEGDILITADTQVLHARTAFADPSPAAYADARAAERGTCRFFDRVWCRRRTEQDES